MCGGPLERAEQTLYWVLRYGLPMFPIAQTANASPLAGVESCRRPQTHPGVDSPDCASLAGRRAPRFVYRLASRDAMSGWFSALLLPWRIEL
jgi:hypothetical protein